MSCSPKPCLNIQTKHKQNCDKIITLFTSINVWYDKYDSEILILKCEIYQRNM